MAKEYIRHVQPLLSPLPETDEDQPGPSQGANANAPVVDTEPAYTVEGVTGFIQGLSLAEWEELRASRPTPVRSHAVQVRPKIATKSVQTVQPVAAAVRTADGGLHVELAEGSSITVRGPLQLPEAPQK